MTNLKIGIIGAGDIGTTHGNILQKDINVTLGSVYDMDQERSEEFASRFGMEILSSVEEVIADSDAVYITVPNKFHAELTLKVLDEGKHVFCEKPFALSISEAKNILYSTEKAGVVYQLGFNRRLAPAYKKMKVLITEGDLIPRSFNIKMNRGELQIPPWISDSKLTGGFLFESTLHLIDIVCYLFGDVDRITAVGTKSVYPCVDDFSMLFEMKNGCHGVFSSSAHSTWVFPFERVEIYGEHISIFNDEMEAVTYCLGLNVPVEKRDFSTLPIEERWGYTQEDKVFVNRILGLDSDNNNLVATHIEGFKNVEIIESIYDQIGLDR